MEYLPGPDRAAWPSAERKNVPAAGAVSLRRGSCPVTAKWVQSIPALDHFSQVADPSLYVSLPDDWHVGVADVVDSTIAIEAGRYKAVNLAGAATIGAAANALGGDLPLFAFGGDGARLAVPPEHAAAASRALSQVAMWARRDLDLELRVGMTTVAAIRAAGFDARVAFWQSSDHVRYAMFTGGGLEWTEKQLKSGVLGLPVAAIDDDPDLTGLSCQWGAILPRNGNILSLIVKQVPGTAPERFAEIVSGLVAVLETAGCLNPLPAEGPDVRWPSGAVGLQSRIARQGLGGPARFVRVLAGVVLTWLVFKLQIRVGGFEPNRYRREIAENSDFRKFDDGLMMTVDCSSAIASQIRSILDEAAAEGIVRYGMQLQEEALMTCVVPSVLTSDHVHFVDVAGGGYASAAKMMNGQTRI